MAEVILPPEESEPELPEEQLPEVDKPTDLSKVITVKFNPLDTGMTSTANTRQSFYTTDTDAWVVFEIENMDAPNGEYSLVLYNKSDGSIFQRTGYIVNGAAYYKIEEEEIEHAGDWVGQVVITLVNGKTTTSRFSFNVAGHLLDGKDVRQIVIQDFETLMKQLEDLKNTADIDINVLKSNIEEAQRLAKESELARQETFEANESERIAAEDERKQAELLRDENYDSKVDAAIVEADVVTKVDDKVAELSPTIQNVTAQLAHMEIEVFEELPSTSQLKEGEFGFVIDVAQQQYDGLNLSFEKLNVNNFPLLFANSPVGGGVKINETHLSEIKSTDGTFRSIRIGQKGGNDGASNYSRLNTATVIPLDGSKKIFKSDLINFRFSVKPISENCYDGSGTYNGSLAVSFRGSQDEVLGTETAIFFAYDSFGVPSDAIAKKMTMDEWTIVKWDLHEACKKRGINFDLVEGIVLTFRGYTNHSTSSVEFLIDDISFGV